MADISAITQSISSSTSTTTTESSENTLGQEDFLTLLVAQLQNQDPLNPADATEFTAQLAQYSQLEQLFNLNDSMDELAAAQTSSQRISALSLIGKDVLVEGSEFAFDEEEAELGYIVDGTVTDVNLIIQDQYGNTVTTISSLDSSEGNHTFTWNGKDSEGEDVEAGTYNLVIQAVTGGESASASVSPLIRTEVTGVDLNGTEPMLVTASGEFAINEVHGAFDANDTAESEEEPEDGETTAESDSTTVEETVSAATDGAGIIESVVESLQEG
jgi:flagellar basal-body rod modification protein FlgD